MLRSQAKRRLDDFLSSFARPEKMILRSLPGKAPSARKLCLFSHFDPHQKVDPYVLYYLQNLRDLGCETLFVSTCSQLSDADLDLLTPYCTQIILRKNLGLDFGSWKVALLHSPDLSRYEQLILANDSVYGPLYPLAPIFESMSQEGAQKEYDLWGITSSSEIQFHIQSYFLVFNPKAFQSTAFQEFWNTFRYYRSKARIIEAYEIGLSRLAQKNHWRIGAYIESETATNPTLFGWRELIEKWRSPFLKTEVLRLNRTHSPDVSEWKSILAAHSQYPLEKISEHLSRIRAPI